MRVNDITSPNDNDDEPVRIQLRGFPKGPDDKPEPSPARKWIDKVYAKFPQTWDNNHVMSLGGEGNDQQFAMFELSPSYTKRGAVEVKWFQAYPLRQGVGSRAMRTLQDLAREDGITLTLWPWKNGRISQAKLKKFYQSTGFKPVNKGANVMAWDPTVDETVVADPVAQHAKYVRIDPKTNRMLINGFEIDVRQHILDRMVDPDPDRFVAPKQVANMIRDTFKLHADELNALAIDSAFVIRAKNGTGIGAAKVEHPGGKHVYVLKTVHPRLKQGADQATIMVEAAAGNDQDDDIYHALVEQWHTMVSEGLTYKDPVATWVAVFKASRHPKFNGKTAEQREKMARMAQYKAVQNKKPFTESALLGKGTPTEAVLAKQHNVGVAEIKQQLARGIKIELEHTDDRKIAREIALDHLGEKLYYYDMLKKAGLEEAEQYPVSQLQEAKKRRAKTIIDGMIKSLIKQGRTHDEAIADLKKQVDSRFYEAIDALANSDMLEENLRDWFKQKWVRFGPDGKIRGDCARGSDSEGKPKCLPQSKAHALGKNKRATAARRKRREDPNPERRGKATNVRTKESVSEDTALLAATRRMQRMLNDRFGANLDIDGHLGPLTLASINQFMPTADFGLADDPSKTTAVQGLRSKTDEACWTGYHRQGNKRKAGRTVPNCVANEDATESAEICPHCGGAMYEASQISEKQDACYYKVKSRYKVWPSAYASGALVQCRKKGAKNWGKSKTKESAQQEDGIIGGKDMLVLFKKMHHEHGYNQQMEQWIAKHSWTLDTIEPDQLQDMYNDDEDADPFERVVWLDDADVTKYERILGAGELVNPIIMGPGRTVIDGNHRAQAAKNLGVSIPGYVPIDNSLDESKVTPSEKYLKLADALEDYANKNISHAEPGFGDFMYHAELIRKGHPDIHKQDFNTVQQKYRKIMSDMIKQHLEDTQLTETFDQPYPWTWTSSGKNRGIWIAEFNDVDVLFDFQKSLGVWNMSFDRNDIMTATGEGDQFKIFATVIDIAKDFVRQMQPEKLSFYTQKDPDEVTNSRPKLYSAMVKRFASSLGYDSTEQTNADNDYVTYMLTKKQDDSVAEGQGQQISVQQLATISDEALDNAYHYGRSTPGNTFGWQANLKSAAYAKQMIDRGVTDIEAISDAIHKGWNVTAKAFVNNPEQFDDTEKLKAAGKLEAKLQQRAKLMNIGYAQLPDDEQEKDRVVARALLQAINGQQGVAEGKVKLYTDPDYYGADVSDDAGAGLPVKQIPLKNLVGFEPDDKMKGTKSAANMRKMVKLIKAGNGNQLPPILVRSYENGYQVLDGHHRFHAYQAAGAKTIPAKLIPADEIEVIDTIPTNENFADGVLEGPKNFADMKLDNNNIQQELDYYYTGHAPANIGGRKDVGSLKGLDIVTFNNGTNTLMFLVNKDDTAVFYVAYRPFGKGVVIGNVRSNGTVRATEVYAYLVDNFGTLYSDTKQTPQGRKIWDNLAKFYPNLSVIDVGNRLKATNNVNENFADGKHPEDKGDSRRHGIPKHATLAQLDKIAHQGGRKGQLAHWQANMRRGRAKTNEAAPAHGDNRNEAAMMLAGTKQAALINELEFEKLYAPHMATHNWIVKKFWLPDMEHNFYVIGQPSELDRVKRIGQLVYNMNKSKQPPDAEYHTELGHLLGYSEADIEDFLAT